MHCRKSRGNNPVFPIFGIECRQEDYEMDSGQMIIRKDRSWRALNLAHYMNVHHDFYYRFLWKDKDTFRIAWKATDTRFHFIQSFISPVGFITDHTQKVSATTRYKIQDSEGRLHSPSHTYTDRRSARISLHAVPVTMTMTMTLTLTLTSTSTLTSIYSILSTPFYMLYCTHTGAWPFLWL
jgi:hypothetical protein